MLFSTNDCTNFEYDTLEKSKNKSGLLEKVTLILDSHQKNQWLYCVELQLIFFISV